MPRSPKSQYYFFGSGVDFHKWVTSQGFRVIGFRDPHDGDTFVKWEASPGRPITQYLKTQDQGDLWIPGDPLAIVEKISL